MKSDSRFIVEITFKLQILPSFDFFCSLIVPFSDDEGVEHNWFARLLSLDDSILCDGSPLSYIISVLVIIITSVFSLIAFPIVSCSSEININGKIRLQAHPQNWMTSQILIYQTIEANETYRFLCSFCSVIDDRFAQMNLQLHRLYWHYLQLGGWVANLIRT